LLSFDSKFDVCVLEKIVARFDDAYKLGVVVSSKSWHDLRNHDIVLDQVEYRTGVRLQIMARSR